MIMKLCVADGWDAMSAKDTSRQAERFVDLQYLHAAGVQ